MKYLFVLLFLFSPLFSYARCDYPDDLDSAGRRCGKRAASVRPGGRLGGDGSYSNPRSSYGGYEREVDNTDSDDDSQYNLLDNPQPDTQRNNPYGL